MWRRLKAWLFRAADYPDKGVAADRPYLDRLAANLNASPQAPNFDIEHFPTDGVLDFARVVPGSAQVVTGAPPGGEVGDWLQAEVEIDPAIDDRLKTRNLSVMLENNPANPRVDKVTVTANPRVVGAQFDAGEGRAVIDGGYLMKVRFNNPEPELSDGFISTLREKLGLGKPAVDDDAGQEPPAADEGGGEAEFSDEAFLSDPRTKALIAKFGGRISQLEEKVAASEETATRANALATEQALAAFSTGLKANGVPPWLVDVLAPVALGATQVKVAFTKDGGEVEFKDLDPAGAAKHVLEQFSGAVPMNRRLPADDTRQTADPDTQAAELAKQIKAEHPEFSIAKCQLLADERLQMTGGQ